MVNQFTKEESLLAKRFIDLSRQAQSKGIVTFSDFLNLHELHIFQSGLSEIYSGYQMSGGYEYSERQMIAFLPDALMFPESNLLPEYPITCCKIKPRNPKFADECNHRDVLGSIMHLGVERTMIGDIIVNNVTSVKENEIYVFCHNKIWEYLSGELKKIKHTNVTVLKTNPDEILIHPKTTACDAIITSNRLDSLIAVFCKLSRTKAANLIKNGKVFINNREMASVTYECKPNEMVSVRSIGRFRYLGCVGGTKKGRYKIRFEKYI